MQNTHKLILISLAAMGLGACSDSSDTQPAEADAAPATLASSDKKAAGLSSPGKPGAPISFRYQVQGTPLVGQPVAINVFVSSSTHDGAISVHYRVNDASSMMFPESQALRTEFNAAPGDEPRSQQITVIPQKEGRLYLNVSAEIQTPNGVMMKTQAIPIQVGAAPRELEPGGELKETEDGDTVVSLPSS